jgi:hypothetical protein
MIKKCLTFVLVCSVALAQGGAKCYQNYEADWFNCEMRYYEKIGPAQNTATTEKRLIDQWFDFEKEQCDTVFRFDDNACERKRKLDALNAELTFSIGTDAAGITYTGCLAICAAQLLIPGWGEVAIVPCGVGCSSALVYTLIKIKTDFDLESRKISNAKRDCGEAASAKRDLCVRLKDNEARFKKGVQDDKFDSIEKPAFQQKESCIRWATTTYNQCMSRQP